MESPSERIYGYHRYQKQGAPVIIVIRVQWNHGAFGGIVEEIVSQRKHRKGGNVENKSLLTPLGY